MMVGFIARVAVMAAFLPLLAASVLRADEPRSVAGAKHDAKRAALDYNRDIRPILSNNCFKCHGPDAAQRKAGLRLDLRDAALKPGESGATPIVPGKPETSELVARIFAEDDDERMPPAGQRQDADRRAERAAEALDRRGRASTSSTGRSSRPSGPRCPRSSTPPGRATRSTTSSSPGWKRDGLQPSPEADRATLIRRLSLDLTGLPPTPAEVDAFLLDDRPDAYEQVVDRLLASPALRRADGAGLARRGPLRRHQRLPHRQRPRHVALARLGHRRLQPQPAVRPVHDRAARRRPAARRRRPRTQQRSPPASTATT